MTNEYDSVDTFIAQWHREWPDLDVSPMATLGRINRISRLMAPHIEKLFAAYGLERGEFDVLATLKRSGPDHRLTPTELYGALMITSGGLTHRLKRLEKAGLVRRVPSAEDRRSLLVELTEEGHEKVVAAFEKDMALEASWLEALTPDERAQLATLLRRLATSFPPPDESLSAKPPP
ncbi:MarR family transcriptional regulator [Sulfitobacter sp. LCG007]